MTDKIYFIGNELYDAGTIKNVTFFPLFNYSKKSSIYKVISYSLSIFKVIKLIKKSNPDIIHIQWIRLWIVDYLFLKYLLLRKKNVIYTAHNILPHKQGKNDYLRYSKYYHLLSNVIVHTEISKKELINDFNIEESKIHVIPHGTLDLSTSLDISKVESLKEELIKKFKLKDKIVFSILGNQDLYKGSDLVFDVWINEFKNRDDLFLFACGKKSNDLNHVNTKELKSLDNTYVDFTKIDSELFLAILQITSVILLPYRKISQSGVLLSAVNESIPFLVSNKGGLPEPLSIADVGWNIGEATIENLSFFMKKISDNRAEYLEKKENKDWNKLKNYYSWKEIGKKTQNLYKIIISK